MAYNFNFNGNGNVDSRYPSHDWKKQEPTKKPPARAVRAAAFVYVFKPG